ncbi:putative terpene synthase metal binding domain protein [Alicycliphilus sp. B1]|nr:putative terpene synthase metal binding domain protein [Alicycliphilus sp. B1]
MARSTRPSSWRSGEARSTYRPPASPAFGQRRDPQGPSGAAAEEEYESPILAMAEQSQGVELAAQPLAHLEHAFAAVNELLAAFLAAANDAKAREHQADHGGGHGQGDQEFQQGEAALA